MKHSHLGQLPDLLDLGFTLFRLEGLDGIAEEVLVVVESGTGWDTIVVLSSQETRCERGPSVSTDTHAYSSGMPVKKDRAQASLTRWWFPYRAARRVARNQRRSSVCVTCCIEADTVQSCQ